MIETDKQPLPDDDIDNDAHTDVAEADHGGTNFDGFIKTTRRPTSQDNADTDDVDADDTAPVAAKASEVEPESDAPAVASPFRPAGADEVALSAWREKKWHPRRCRCVRI